jgi:hypothetical protein
VLCNRFSSVQNFDEYCVKERNLTGTDDLPPLMSMETVLKVLDFLTGRVPALTPRLLKRSQCLKSSVPSSATIYASFAPEN